MRDRWGLHRRIRHYQGWYGNRQRWGAQAKIADGNAAHREYAASAGRGSHGVARGAVEIPLIQERYGRGVWEPDARQIAIAITMANQRAKFPRCKSRFMGTNSMEADGRSPCE